MDAVKCVLGFLLLADSVGLVVLQGTNSTSGHTIQSLETQLQQQQSTLQVLQTREFLQETTVQQHDDDIRGLQASRDSQASAVQILQTTLTSLEDKLEKQASDMQILKTRQTDLENTVQQQARTIHSLQDENVAQGNVIRDLKASNDACKNTNQRQASDIQILKTLQAIQGNTLQQQEQTIRDLQTSQNAHGATVTMLEQQCNVTAIKELQEARASHENTLQQQGKAIQRLQATCDANQHTLAQYVNKADKKAAFYVDFGNHPFGPVYTGHLQPIHFNRVLLNTNNNYNMSTGVFTAPYDGLYIFTLTIYNHQGLMTVGIYTSDAAEPHALAMSQGLDQDPYDLDTCSTVLHLSQGDEVSAQHYDHDMLLYGSKFTSFMGVLVHAD